MKEILQNILNYIKKLLSYNIEKAILNNITRIAFYLIFFLIITYFLSKIYKFNFLDITGLITIVGAIIAFWYGYKKYERDKEIEIFEKYTELYNKIKTEKDYNKLINFWYKEFYLKSRGYITKVLWEDWKNWIKEDLLDILKEDSYDPVIIFANFSTFFAGWDNNIKSSSISIDGKNYYNFILDLIGEIKSELNGDESYKFIISNIDEALKYIKKS